MTFKKYLYFKLALFFRAFYSIKESRKNIEWFPHKYYSAQLFSTSTIIRNVSWAANQHYYDFWMITWVTISYLVVLYPLIFHNIMVFDQINSVFVKKTTFKKHNWLQHNNLWIALTWELIQFESWEYNNLSAEFETHHFQNIPKRHEICFFKAKYNLGFKLLVWCNTQTSATATQHHAKTQHNTSNMSKPASAQHTTRCIPSSFRTTYNTNNNKMFFCCLAQGHRYTTVFCICNKVLMLYSSYRARSSTLLR